MQKVHEERKGLVAEPELPLAHRMASLQQGVELEELGPGRQGLEHIGCLVVAC